MIYFDYDVSSLSYYMFYFPLDASFKPHVFIYSSLCLKKYTVVPETPLFTSSILNEDAEILEETKVNYASFSLMHSIGRCCSKTSLSLVLSRHSHLQV